MPTDWDAEARKFANMIREERQGTRGGILTAAGVCLLYDDNDFAHDDRARLEVTLLRRHLSDARVRELGFATSDDGRAWAMAVECRDLEGPLDAQAAARRVAFGGEE